MVDTYLGLLAATLLKYDDAEAVSDARRSSHSGSRAVVPGVLTRSTSWRRSCAPGRTRRRPSAPRSSMPTRLRTRRGARDGTRPANSPRCAAACCDRARLAREGDYWAVDFGADSFRVRDAKGMHHLARLLQSPGIELHALDLVLAGGRIPVTNGVHEAELTIGDPSDTGPLLDAEAKAAYRERLRAIEEEIAEAERWNDPERAARLDGRARSTRP